MIHTSLSALTVIYLALMLGPIICAWLFAEWHRRRRERDAFRDVLRCRLCACEYADTTATPLPRCPHCGALNERFGLSRL